MIIVKIQGGLGNQLFQYAFGRCVAIKNGCKLKLDLSFYESGGSRQYALNHFDVVGIKATPADFENLRRRDNGIAARVKKKLFKGRPYLIKEKSLKFEPGYLETGDHTYLSGYWQSQNYFSGISALIKKELTVKTPPSAANKRMAAAIELLGKGRSVSLHMRRGDFAQDRVIRQVHGTCTLDYYDEAVTTIADRVAEPVFFVFSDDIAWAKENLNLPYDTTYVDINDEDTSYEDLRLMQHCSHHILANSTFSWWGAWLSAFPEAIVVAPQKWFNNAELNKQASSITPENWIRL